MVAMIAAGVFIVQVVVVCVMEKQMAERKDAIIALRSSPSMCKDASCHPSSMAKTAKPLLVGHSLPFENK